MSTQKESGNPSRKECHQIIDQLFREISPEEVDKTLWQILVAAMNSKDTNDLTPWERGNLLCLYRTLTSLVADLHRIHVSFINQTTPLT